jgi:hypothetical protein
VIDALFEGILEAGLRHRALGADSLRGLHADSIARKEDGGRHVSTFPHGHPFHIHCPSIDLEEAAVGLAWSVPTLVPPASVALLVSHFEVICSWKWAGIDGILTIFL